MVGLSGGENGKVIERGDRAPALELDNRSLKNVVRDVAEPFIRSRPF